MWIRFIVVYNAYAVPPTELLLFRRQRVFWCCFLVLSLLPFIDPCVPFLLVIFNFIHSLLRLARQLACYVAPQLALLLARTVARCGGGKQLAHLKSLQLPFVSEPCSSTHAVQWQPRQLAGS